MTDKKINAAAKAYIDKVIAENKKQGMKSVPKETYARAVKEAADTAARVIHTK